MKAGSSTGVAIALMATALASSPARADQVLLRVQSWTVTAADRIDCSKPPVITVGGPGTLFDDANRNTLQAVIAGITPVLKRQCSTLREIVLANGRTRRVVALAAASDASAPPVAPPVARPGAPAAPPAAPAPSPAATAPPPVAPPATRITPAPAAPTPRAATPAPLKPLTPYPDRRLAALDKTRGTDEKCELLLTWLGRLQQEYPNTVGARIVNPAQGLALYRDQDFVQLFERPFDQTTTKWRAETHEKVVGKCQGMPQTGINWANPQAGRVRRPGMTTYQSQFEPFRTLLDGPFLSQAGPLSPQAVTAAVAQAREARAWMDAAINESASLPPTLATFRDLETRIGDSRTRLTMLWPSEQRHFADQLAARRTDIASTIVDGWIADIGAFGTTLPDLQRLAEERRLRREVLAAADAARQAAEQTAYTAKVDALVGPLAAARASELSSVPATMAGARQSLEGQSAFDRDFQAYADRPAVASARTTLMSHHRRVLEGALPEWQTLVEQPSATQESLQKLTATLGELFPAAARSEPLYGKYQQALDRQIEIRRQADYAAAAGQCDAVAAHPDDPEATAAGVSEERLNAAGVIAACEPAVKAAGAEPRLEFQLARGYLKAERYEDAVEHLLVAANEEHGGALAYLGDLHLDGGPGIDADPAMAHSLYERALESGFTPAKTVLSQFEDFTDRAAEVDEAAEAEVDSAAADVSSVERKFNNPEIVENVLRGDLDAVPFGELYTKLYLVNMAENIAEECNAHFTARDVSQLKMNAALKSADFSPAAGAASLMNLLTELVNFRDNPGAFVQRSAQAEQDQEQLPIEAMRDTFTLMSRHPCGSGGMTQFSTHLVSYVNGADVPRLSTEQMFNLCSNTARPTGRYDARNFCTCFVPALNNTPLSRMQRKRLSADFWPTAQEIMNKDPARFNVCVHGPSGGHE